MMTRVLVVLMLQFGAMPQAIAQTGPPPTALCGSTTAIFPTRVDVPAVNPSQPRFEMRQCEGSDLVQIAAFEARAKEPAILLDPPERWPGTLLVHVANVLVLQTFGGTSSTVYILSFVRGKAQKVIGAETTDEARVHVDEAQGKVIVDVPPYSRYVGGVLTPARRYEVRLER
jgi:hypothetical protein